MKRLTRFNSSSSRQCASAPLVCLFFLGVTGLPAADLNIAPAGPLRVLVPAGTQKCVQLRAIDFPQGSTLAWAVLGGPGTVSPTDKALTQYCVMAATGLVQIQVTSTHKDANGKDITASADVDIDLVDKLGGLFQRLIAGAEFSGGAATQPTGRFFMDMMLSTAIGPDSKDGFGPKARLWVDTRISSVPQQFNAKVSEFLAGGIATGIKDLKVNEVVQTIEMLGGPQYRLWSQKAASPLFFDRRLSRTAVHAIAAYGGITPFVPRDFINSYQKPDKASDAYARLESNPVFAEALRRRPDAKYLSFVPLDRQRFWRQYYGGLRIQSHFYEWNGAISQTPMRTVDLLIGQNEVITGGSWRGTVLRADFFQPIVDLKQGVTVYVFGTASWKASVEKASSTSALILNPLTANEQGTFSVTSKDTIILNSPVSNRDFFRIGVGIDFKKVFGGGK
ncbi:MAG: hypothetical protein NTV70_08365 [Acidobacteria bacterium]|nr:hypothetical protein [Acidobacteriota bacterium]